MITCSTIIENNEPKDKDLEEVMVSELSNGNSFFIYQSDSVDSLSSCCRLNNKLSDHTFSNTMGAGGIATGSINVITLNINRITQRKVSIQDITERVVKYHYAYRKILENLNARGMLPIYSARFITLNKQFSTIGINGLLEAAESKGIKVSYNDEYKQFVNFVLSSINDVILKANKKYQCLYNIEYTPCENLGVKNAKWDKEDGIISNSDCYNSYFYRPEDATINLVNKFLLHGKEFINKLSGGSALHLNLEEYPSKEGYRKLLHLAAKTGCNYFTTNVKITICNDCGNIDKRTLNKCPKCGSTNIDYATRIIGYLKRISSFSKERQLEAAKRFYHQN